MKRHYRPSAEVLKKPWVIVANRTEARIFDASKAEPKLIRRIMHYQGRASNQALKEGKPGRSFESWSGSFSRHTMSSEVDPQEQEAINFAKMLSELLKKARSTNLIDRMTLVSDPHFLGLLLSKLDTSTKRLIEKTIQKNLAHLSDHEVIRYLADLDSHPSVSP